MPKFKNSNATFWVIFKHCAMLLFAIGIMESLVDLGRTQTESFNFLYLAPVCKLQIWVSLSAMTKFMRSSSVAAEAHMMSITFRRVINFLTRPGDAQFSAECWRLHRKAEARDIIQYHTDFVTASAKIAQWAKIVSKNDRNEDLKLEILLCIYWGIWGHLKSFEAMQGYFQAMWGYSRPKSNKCH